ncbi:MAG: phosphoglucosamine mutase [Bacillota bacterium]
MTRLFGTDGVRGIANEELTPELAFKIGRATAQVLRNKEKQKVLIGRDTRASSSMLEAAVAAGLCSAGVDVVCAGTITTPGVAYLVRNMGFDGGVVISASHNPAKYNGIKIFGSDGFKIPDETEDRIESLVGQEQDRLPRPSAEGIGVIEHERELVDEYVSFLIGSAGTALRGLKIVLDCANGATTDIAPRVFRRLGAEVLAMNTEPDGLNINKGCGSTQMEPICRMVKQKGADLGLAFDGDGDRVLGVSEKGEVVDGDQILAICAMDMIDKGELPEKTVVGTVMSNLGLDIALRRVGGRVIRTRVGDRNVLEEMRRRELVLGGEQSGHIIFLSRTTTGDGILTGLLLSAICKNTGRPLSDLASVMEKLPQVLVNVRSTKSVELSRCPATTRAIADAEAELGTRGRVLVRASGTEPLIRIMVEGDDEAVVKRLATHIKEVVEEELG